MREKIKELRYVPSEEEEIVLESKEAKTEKSNDEAIREPVVQLLKEEMDYLESITREPFLPVTERDRKLEISGWKGHSLREKLIKKEVIEKVAINTKKRGGVIYLTKITEKGREIANSLGMGANILRGKGGFTHQFWADRIKSYFEQTGEAVPSIEDDSLGKAVDVSLIFPNKKVAVEIEINENESFNISKDLFSGYDDVWICSESEEQIEKSKKRVQDNPGEEIFEKVKFRLLSEFDERARNIIGNIGAQPVWLRAGKEEKAEKEKEVEKKERRVGGKEENVLKNINKKQSHGENDLLTAEEVSLDLGLSLSTVKKWVAKRVLPVIELGQGEKGPRQLGRESIRAQKRSSSRQEKSAQKPEKRKL